MRAGCGDEVSLALVHRADAAHTARHALLGMLVDEDPAFARDAMLTISELVSNVFVHTDNGCTVSARYPDEHTLRLEVSDTSTVLPHLTSTGDGLRRDRHGLDIVDILATRWGVESYGGGKTVWAELAA